MQDRLDSSQLGGPVGQLAFAFSGFEPLPLPDGVVGVLDGQCRLLRGLAQNTGPVLRHEFVDHQLQGPAVRDDVVHHHHQDVLLGVQADQ
ncbi:hypothetical protein D3C72_2067130 [compost metagenome]